MPAASVFPAHVGHELTILLNSTAPGTLDDSSLYTEVLYVKGYSFDMSAAELDATNRNSAGSGYFMEFLRGKTQGTVSIDGLYDIARETGQQLLPGSVEATTQAGAKRWFFVTTDSSGLEEIYGTVLVTNFNHTGNDGELPTFTATLRLMGQWTRQATP